LRADHLARSAARSTCIPAPLSEIISPVSRWREFHFKKRAVDDRLLLASCSRGRKPDETQVVALSAGCIDGIDLSETAMSPIDGRQRSRE